MGFPPVATRLPADCETHFDSGEKLCEYVAQHTDTIVLSFSRGKDALAAWVQSRRFFKRIIPVFMYDIPGLDFVEADLAYYEDFFKTEIECYPSPDLHRAIRLGIFQPWGRANQLYEHRLRRSYEPVDVFKDVMSRFDCRGTLQAFGLKVSDSLARAVQMKNHGSLARHRSVFYPVFDWNNDRMEREFRQCGVKLSQDYRYFVRSFEGPRYAQLAPMKKHLPVSYRQLLRFMPLAEAEIARREFYARENLKEGAYSHR